MTERQRLKNKIDKVFSIFIRTRFANHAGYTSCYTCGVVKHWREMDAGHFQSRGKLSTRWHELNVFQQCKMDNGFKNGEQFKFARQLDADYGEGTAEEIERLSNQTRKYTIAELRDMLKHYQDKVEELDL
tara:strand:- start:21 stop:410 length:390 start_codon:yes stop_codon:yes gene_type:complete